LEICVDSIEPTVSLKNRRRIFFMRICKIQQQETTLEEVMQEFLSYKVAQHISERTLKDYVQSKIGKAQHRLGVGLAYHWGFGKLRGRE